MAKNLIGTNPDQVPSNADLGTLAYQDSSNVRIDHLIIDSNVGIGIASPAYKLDVVGDINFTGSLYQNGLDALINTRISPFFLIGT